MVCCTDAKINVAGIDEDSIANGPGLRFVLFVQGCPRNCEGCQNPQTHVFGAGVDWTVEALWEKIRANPLTRGVTFSGGEPFCQAAPLAELGGRIRAAGLELAIYTGFRLEELLAADDPGVRALLAVANVIVDGEFRLAERSMDLHFRGSGNQRVLNAAASLAAGAPVLEPSPRWA